ncbi:NAD-dependent epimerase/dehydratase family protein [Rhodopseudomonas pseudopalustris]|uniref:GDP-4-dehydro-6-deoxy-D-mannose reductase n=1 Tax=Rhodopseudomonas pseudopalustris TaxID=1513892 RepID=A0A1H8USA9_9BRAD|nr:NAD-dependent epimerase/dehydratase family protein [Rhodopseudomonas pseudopalustris]MBB1093119.1 NAD-dependent epimerase/dehydratase family protein [Rhodopseudomonas palustris]SEP05877.1 GDP-4-dehydro-6-deoxy-D-mannose reductase [Rhodopseudomonas pseudopalustris]
MASASAPLRILITGATGFVGPHLAAAIRQRFGDRAELTATALDAGDDAVLGAIKALDVTDRAAVEATIGDLQPTHLVNLAALAAPAAANADPALGWRVHLDGPRNLGHAILAAAPACVLVHIGSGLAYGRTASDRPATEQTVLAPRDDYGASKAAADLALGALVAKGLRCVRFRPFNHTGPGQTDAFVVPAFARQIAQIEAGVAPPLLRVGNLDGQRDFLDVRDVAAAYVEAIARSELLEPGLILNVASGLPRRIGDILQQLLALTPEPIDVQRDPARDRADPADIIVGDATRARTLLDWKPTIDFATTIADVLNDQRARIGRRAE